ncbi:MAG: DUF1049 domain-containing protein [Sediminispirochaetaceae bacterium]
MLRLILHIVLLAVLAVFVAMNVPYKTSINLFGYMFEDISTVAVVLISLIAGVVYSFIYYILSYFRKSGIKRAKKRAEKTKDRQKELKEKENLLKTQTQENGKGTKELEASPSPAAEETKRQNSAEESTQTPKKKKGLFTKGGKKE